MSSPTMNLPSFFMLSIELSCISVSMNMQEDTELARRIDTTRALDFEQAAFESQDDRCMSSSCEEGRAVSVGLDVSGGNNDGERDQAWSKIQFAR
ncbi:hypothetical protein KCU83_g99, partial [Aureobasidium melanogenum]